MPDVATMLSTRLTEELATKAASGFVSVIKDGYAARRIKELKFLIDRGLPNYLRAQTFRCERIKTLLSRNEPVLLSDCFVPPKVVFRKKTLDFDEVFTEIFSHTHAAVVSAPAGSGKSAFLKAAFLKSIEKGSTFYPIFFEMRRLNRAPADEKDLRAEIIESIRETATDFPEHLFDFGLKRGSFFFFLDGFDEVNYDIRGRISDDLETLVSNFQDCNFLLTSRPSEDFRGWNTFSHCHLKPFSMQQAVEYVQKLPFDEEEKASFINDLSESLYESNRAFLSNPLLTAMMLITYSSYGEIPTKRHVFYEKCLDVLTREHDSLKGRYKRRLFSKIPIEDISEITKFVSVLSYKERKFRFTKAELEDYIRKACLASTIEANEAAVLRDLQESISLMIMDGMEYEYIHRSFQEYFYARFVVDDRRLKLSEKIDWLVADLEFDTALDMIREMDPSYIEDQFIIPNLRKFLSEINGVDLNQSPASFFSKFYTEISTATRHFNEKGEEETELRFSFHLKSPAKHYYLLRMARHEFFGGRQAANIYDDLGIDPKEIATRVDQEFKGSIKFHHTNNQKLVALGFGRYACWYQNKLAQYLISLEKRSSIRGDVMMDAFNEAYLR